MNHSDATSASASAPAPAPAVALLQRKLSRSGIAPVAGDAAIQYTASWSVYGFVLGYIIGLIVSIAFSRIVRYVIRQLGVTLSASSWAFLLTWLGLYIICAWILGLALRRLLAWLQFRRLGFAGRFALPPMAWLLLSGGILESWVRRPARPWRFELSPSCRISADGWELVIPPSTGISKARTVILRDQEGRSLPVAWDKRSDLETMQRLLEEHSRKSK